MVVRRGSMCHKGNRTATDLSARSSNGEILTIAAIDAALKRSTDGSEEWLPDGSGRGSGRLQLRAKGGKGFWYFRYTRPSGGRDSLALGQYLKARTKADDDQVSGSLTLVQARQRAGEMAAMLRDPETADIRATLERRRRNVEVARQVEKQEQERAEAQARAAEDAKRQTVRRLCELYLEYLTKMKRSSVGNVKSAFSTNVFNDPIAERPARDVTKEEFALLLHSVKERRPKMVRFVRSYLHAAYNLACNSVGDMDAPRALADFKINGSPLQNIKAAPSEPRDRHLSLQELKMFLGRLEAAEPHPRDALKLCIYAGGQRPKQMLRAELKHFDKETGTLTLFDPKGRRSKPRTHRVILGTKGARLASDLANRAEALDSRYLFTLTGKNPMRMEVLSALVRQISKTMVEEKEIAEPFQMKDLRRTAETMLAGLGVSKDLRAQIQSHGLSGVQDRVYDHFDYAPEKKKALMKWERRIAEIEGDAAKPAKVVPIR